MDRFIHNIRLGLERLLYKDEKDLLSEEIQKYSKDVFNDYDIIKMIVSIFSNKYAELSEEEAELAEIEDVPEVGEARANWNRARGKALLAKQLLNGIALDENNNVGMYDKITETFFYNQGTGTFGYEVEELDANSDSSIEIE